MLELNRIHCINCIDGLKQMDTESVHCCVTSPPYWGLRDYGVDGQLGLEATPEEYVAKMVEVFRQVKRVLRDDGTLWLNLGDSYAGSGKGQWETNKGQKEVYIPTKDSPQCHLPKTPIGLKPKDLVGIPWMVAFALRADGWYLRSDIIWSKPNVMPESVTDRPTKAHEYIFMLSKSEKYYYDYLSIKEPSQDPTHDRPQKRDFGGKNKGKSGYSFRHTTDFRNKRTVWAVCTSKFKGSHFATFPPKLIEPCILAGCPKDGIVLDPFMGSGTTAMVAKQNQRNYIGFELNPKYIKISDKRTADVQLKIV